MKWYLIFVTFSYLLASNLLAQNQDKTPNQGTMTMNEPKAANILPIPSDKPSKFQLEQIARKYGMFIHFGVNTFVDKEWTDGSIPTSVYKPQKLNTAQWVKTAKDAGMKYVILVTKHHDGFCLWDSPLTDYDVGSTEFKTNIVESLASDCAKENIGFGIYYSLWDRKHNAQTKNAQLDIEYNKFMLEQLKEIFVMAGKYGPVVELWLDGSWEKPNTRWPLQDIYSLVKEYQPGCQVGVNWSIGHPNEVDKTCHANEQKKGYPIRYFPSDFRLGDPELPTNDDPKLFSFNEKLYYMPWETTVCLSEKWFYNSQDHKYKSDEELIKLYKHATSQDNILIINCPPNIDGLMREKDAEILKHLAKNLGILKE